jgi:acetyl esterase/lipase
MIMKALLCLLIAFSSWGATQPSKDLKPVLEVLKKNTPKPIEKMTVDEARLQDSPQAVAEALGKKSGKMVPISSIEISDIGVEGASGKLPARVYKPKGEGLLPVILYFHGGGWVLGKNEDYDVTLKSLASKTGAIILSPEYRKAPEYKFPAAHDDAFAVYLWLLENATKLGGDPKKIAVAGESAGGNLAINVSIRARDQKKPLPIHQLLVYPVAGTDTNSPSYVANQEAAPLNSPMMGWFFKNYLRSTEDLKDKRIDLVNADLRGLPTTTILTAEIDPLRSEGKTLAQRLQSQGVEVSYREYEGMTHEFFSMSPMLKQAEEAQAEVSEELKDTFKGKAKE